MYSVSSPPAVLRHAGSWSTWRSRLRARKPETPVSTGQCDVVVARVAGCGGGADATKLRLRRARVSALRGSSRGDRAHRRPEGDSAHPQPSQSTHRRSVTVGAAAALAIGQSDPCTTRTCRCADASRRAPMSDSAHRGAIRRCVRGISSQHDCLTGVLRRLRAEGNPRYAGGRAGLHNALSVSLGAEKPINRSYRHWEEHFTRSLEWVATHDGIAHL